MAVVQISKIQIRRGQKNSGTGLPQLASGEMAWAVDTQELYIGNGSVAEGSPGVGNTKIITQKDLASENNLFGLVQYVYKTDDELTVRNNAPVTRTLQERLDDQVVTTDFGTLGTYNAVTEVGDDDTDTLQFAINQLFLNAANKASGDVPASVSSRVILVVPPGTFKISKPIYIPSYTTLIGAGLDKTVIYYKPQETYLTGTTINTSNLVTNLNATADMVGAFISGDGIQDGTTIVSINGTTATISQPAVGSFAVASLTITVSGPAFQFVNDFSSAGDPSPLTETLGLTQPRKIQITGMSIHTTSAIHTCVQMDAVRDSLFEDLHISGTASGPYNDASRGIAMAVNGAVTCENNIFRNVVINNFNYGVYTRQDIVNNIFEDCYIHDVRQGFALGIDSDGVSVGEINGPRQTQIVNCKFKDIVAHAVYLRRGDGNSVINPTLINVGSDGAGNTDPSPSVTHYPQIYFGTHGNFVTNVTSDRSLDLEADNFDLVYAPIVSGHGVFNSNTTRTMYLASNEGTVIRLPVATNSSGLPSGAMSYMIHYSFKNTLGTPYQRVGTIVISVDIDNGAVQLSDEYNYAGADTNIVQTAIQLDFSASLLDKVGDPYVSDPQVPYSLLLSYFNNGGADVNGYFIYTFTAIS